jgi:phosphoribosylformylglycinamidine (FGAM) synthase PurS component
VIKELLLNPIIENADFQVQGIQEKIHIKGE